LRPKFIVIILFYYSVFEYLNIIGPNNCNQYINPTSSGHDELYLYMMGSYNFRHIPIVGISDNGLYLLRRIYTQWSPLLR